MKNYYLILSTFLLLSGCTTNFEESESSVSGISSGEMDLVEVSRQFVTPDYVWSGIGESGHPTPPRLIYSVIPEFPQLMIERNTEGRVLIMFIIDKDGSTSHVTAIEATNRLFAESAETAIKEWKYTPAYYEGEPVALRIRFEVPFIFREAQPVAGGDHPRCGPSSP